MFVFELYQIHEALNYDTISVHRLSDHSCKIMRIIVAGTFHLQRNGMEEWSIILTNARNLPPSTRVKFLYPLQTETKHEVGDKPANVVGGSSIQFVP